MPFALRLTPSTLAAASGWEATACVPEAAFTVCTFWLAEAMAMVGRKEDARVVFESVLEKHNGLGLFAEDILVADGSQAGNFPQTYSHVGLINTAFRLARPWD